MKTTLLSFFLLLGSISVGQLPTITLSNVDSNHVIFPVENNRILAISQNLSGLTTFNLYDSLGNTIWIKTDTLIALYLPNGYDGLVFPDKKHYLLGDIKQYSTSGTIDSTVIVTYILDASANITHTFEKWYHYPTDTIFPLNYEIISNTDSTWSSIQYNAGDNTTTRVVKHNLYGDTISTMTTNIGTHFATYPPSSLIRALDNGILFNNTYGEYLYLGRVKADNTVDSMLNASLQIGGVYSWLYGSRPVIFEGNKYLFADYIYPQLPALGLHALYSLDSECNVVAMSQKELKFNNYGLIYCYGLSADDNYIYLINGMTDMLNLVDAIGTVLNVFDHNFNLLCQYQYAYSPEKLNSITNILGRGYAEFTTGATELTLIPLQGCQTSLGVSEYNTPIDISVFPNPSSDEIHIQGLNSLGENIRISIIDMAGKVVFNSSKILEVIHVNTLEEGVYVLKITSTNRTFTHRILVD